jgi:hypothetical protein
MSKEPKDFIKFVKDEFITDVDGFVYYWPKGSSGHYAAWMLRAIADELDQRNAAWQEIIDRELSE